MPAPSDQPSRRPNTVSTADPRAASDDLPSLGALQAFDAALRHRSFTGAAGELGLTQGAISRQIARLEAQLGRQLFHREHARVRPTRAAEQFGSKLARLLARLETLVSEVRSNADTTDAGGVLELACLPTFGTTWLIPRLPDFRARHPDVAIELTTSLQVFDFETEEVDCAIHYGTGVWPGARAERLMDEEMVVVASAERAAELTSPADLAQQPLLQLTSRPWAWPTWLTTNEAPRTDALRGPRFEHHLMILEAARAGLGVALLPTFLAERAITAGDLVEPFPNTRLVTQRRYWLVYPDRTLELDAFQRFREWLREQVD
jgi:LysR family transcriptional regulator, glycine cleavage system transcriptional activator